MKVFFRTDASIQIGTGHVMRCLTFADELKGCGADVSFICRELPGHLCETIEDKGYAVYRLSDDSHQSISYQSDALEPDVTHEHLAHSSWLGTSWQRDADETKLILMQQQPIDVLVIDHYALDSRWEVQMRPFVQKVMVIDDLADRKHDCDLLLDQNLYPKMYERYKGLVPDHCRLLLGPSYALLRPEFQEAGKHLRLRDGSLKRVLIFFGGTDPTNETTKALKAIQLLNKPDIVVDVVVGQNNPHKEEVQRLCEEVGANFYCQVENISELMGQADLAIGAGGSTTWERCYLGLPSLILTVARNQLEMVDELVKQGAVWYLGWHEDVQEEEIADAFSQLIQHPDWLRDMSSRSHSLMHEHGPEQSCCWMQRLGMVDHGRGI